MKEWVVRLGLVVLFASLAMLTLEGVLALIALRASRRQDTFFQPDSCVGWRHIPHKREGTTIVGKVKLDQPINSEGFRDREYPHTKEHGSFRIVLLGDSFADQLEMQTPQLYHEILERKLNSTTVRSIEVINLGVAGFGTAQEYLTLKCYGLEYDPDLVILAFFVGNDLFDNSITLHRQYLVSDLWRPFFQLVDGKLQRIDPAQPSSPITGIAWRLLPRSSAVVSRGKERLLQGLTRVKAKALRERSPNAVSAAIDAPYALYQDPYPPVWESAWAVTKALIVEMATGLNRSKISFLVVVIPNEFEFRPDLWQEILNKNPQMRALQFDLKKPERILSEFFHQNGIRYLLLRPALEERTKRTSEILHFRRRGDNHWNAEGHALAASEILERLVRDGLTREHVHGL